MALTNESLGRCRESASCRAYSLPARPFERGDRGGGAAIRHLPRGEYGLAIQVLPEAEEIEKVSAYT
jgi:hypothetical protein